MTSRARSGAAFVVLIAAAFVVSIGELAGSFADADAVYVDRFADDGRRVRDIAGAYLLAMAGIAFAWFAHALGGDDHRRVALLLGGVGVAGGMLVAAMAWAAAPLSIWFGSLVDDPGLQEGQAVLPTLGYVALTMGAMLPASVFIILVARTAGLVPGWLAVASYPVAVLVAGSALLFMPMFVFVVWAAAVTATKRSVPPAPALR